jgi:small subunit ribosomal protein S21
LQVFVRDNNIDQALRALKKKMQREGVFREMKRRRFYEKPSEMTTRKKAEAVRRARKLARKKAQREGLIAGRPQKRASPDSAIGRPRSNTQSLARSDLPDVRSVRAAAPFHAESTEPLS